MFSVICDAVAEPNIDAPIAPRPVTATTVTPKLSPSARPNLDGSFIDEQIAGKIVIPLYANAYRPVATGTLESPPATGIACVKPMPPSTGLAASATDASSTPLVATDHTDVNDSALLAFVLVLVLVIENRNVHRT
jgi:hypothetical protein